MNETLDFLKARVEALEKENARLQEKLKKAHEFMEKLSKEMEVEFEKL